ncbi:hypothetical protein ACYRFT_02505 [Listeria kieliensis]
MRFTRNETIRIEVLARDEWCDYEMSEKLSEVLELCYSEWFQNDFILLRYRGIVLELCYSEWFQNPVEMQNAILGVLELCYSEWFQNNLRLYNIKSEVLEP